MTAPAGDRTLAPPERREALVTEVTPIGAYELVVARDRLGPDDPRPGQFYMLSTERWGGGDGERPYLPRAFSFARARALDDGGTELSFLLEDVGPGTHRLGELSPGEPLRLLGPLGAGFTAPAEGRRAVLAGGGIGTAPLLALDDALRARGQRPPVVLGFRSAAFAEAAELFAGAPEVVTDDGSRGRAGLVTEPLREELTRDSRATVHACGPPAMLAAVRALCAELQVPAQLALEAGMACGYGACFGCVVETKEGYARVCVDGPVFDAAVLT